MCLHTGPVYRVGTGMVEQAQKIGCTGLEADFQSVIVQGPHAQIFHGLFAGDDILGIEYGSEDLGILGCRGGIHGAAQTIDKVMGGYRVAIGPLRVLADVEDPGLAVVTGFPGFRGSGNDVAIRCFDGQPFVKITQDVGSRYPFRLVGIQGLYFGAVAPVQNLLFCEIVRARERHGGITKDCNKQHEQ